MFISYNKINGVAHPLPIILSFRLKIHLGINVAPQSLEQRCDPIIYTITARPPVHGIAHKNPQMARAGDGTNHNPDLYHNAWNHEDSG